VAVAAGEKPPYAPNDADLFAILSSFDARHEAYGQIQNQMERYWCLRWLDQENKSRVEAVVVRDDLLRLAEAPFYFRVPDVPSLPAGRRVLVDILARDELALDLSARFVEVLAGETQPLADDEVFAEETAEEALEESAEAAALDEQAGSSVGGDGTEPAADALDPPAAGT
jgi:exoribonuclease-2